MRLTNSTKATVLAVLIVLGSAVSSHATDSRYSLFAVLTGFAAYVVHDMLDEVHSLLEQLR